MVGGAGNRFLKQMTILKNALTTVEREENFWIWIT